MFISTILAINNDYVKKRRQLLFFMSSCYNSLPLPDVLLPSTTALGTIDPKGRELGILAGANVVMPNLSPVEVRKKYMLYDNKICTGDEAAECKNCLSLRMNNIGYQIVTDRGDHPGFTSGNNNNKKEE